MTNHPDLPRVWTLSRLFWTYRWQLSATYALFNLEYQFPLNKKVGLGGLFFFDGGQAFAEGDPIRIGDMRYSMGAGVRWRSPFGPLRFEWGFPLAKEEDEDASVFEFSVGSSF